jgi:Tfp pilus assembly protein PilP
MSARRAGVGLAALAAVGLMVGCGGDQKSGPKTSEFGEERKALVERMARRQEKEEKTRPKKAKAGAAEEETLGGVGAFDATFSYDPTGKRDPFRSFEYERPDRRPDDEVRGPLEKFELGQLNLVAVVWRTDNAKALVMDPSGQSYIVGNGTRIGKNEGKVIRIGDNTMVVKETYVDHLGNKTTKDIERRIRESQGG